MSSLYPTKGSGTCPRCVTTQNDDGWRGQWIQKRIWLGEENLNDGLNYIGIRSLYKLYDVDDFIFYKKRDTVDFSRAT